MKRVVSGESSPMAAETNPLRKVIPKRTKLRDFEGCSALREYELLEKIGEGTFGEVHKARHRKTRELVALKRVLMHNEKDGFPITALREIKILKMLAHPNIIKLSDMTVERGDKAKKKRGSIFMVTPYMDHDLCGLLSNPNVKFSVPQIKCYMKQLLEGTEYLHKMRILHRDMKAANLLISNQGILQIADFGLARVYYDEPPPESNEPRREYTNMVVTRWYRPPELLLGERRYTPAIDLWGIGCMLAEMYKGKPILQGQSDLEQLNMIFNLCGTPTEASMPGWTLLPGCENIKSFKTYARQLEREYNAYDKSMISLLAGLLNLDPARRLTATEALKHEYFTTEPLPAKPEDLPNYETSHELDKRKHDANRRAQQPMPKAPDAAGQMANGSQNAQPPMRDSAPPQTSAQHEDRKPYRHEENGRDARRDRSRDRSRSRYDDRPVRDDRYRNSYPRDRDGDSYRERERDRNHAVDTYIPSYSRARYSPSRRDRSRDRHVDSRDRGREERPSGRDYYRDDRGRPDTREAYNGRRSRSRSGSRPRNGDGVNRR